MGKHPKKVSWVWEFGPTSWLQNRQRFASIKPPWIPISPQNSARTAKTQPKWKTNMKTQLLPTYSTTDPKDSKTFSPAAQCSYASHRPADWASRNGSCRGRKLQRAVGQGLNPGSQDQPVARCFCCSLLVFGKVYPPAEFCWQLMCSGKVKKTWSPSPQVGVDWQPAQNSINHQ